MNKLYVFILTLLLVGCKTTKTTTLDEKDSFKSVRIESGDTCSYTNKHNYSSKAFNSTIDSVSTISDSVVNETWDILTKTWTDSTGVTYTEVHERGSRKSHASNNRMFSTSKNSSTQDETLSESSLEKSKKDTYVNKKEEKNISLRVKKEVYNYASHVASLALLLIVLMYIFRKEIKSLIFKLFF